MMAVPFTTRTALIAFFCVTNVGRFWNKTSFLTLSTKALANEIRAMYMSKLIRAAKHKSPELSDDDVVINLFGGFEIYTNIGSIVFTDLSSLQCSRFLLYLLKNRNRTIPVREISDVLWPDQLIDNPYNMVKGVAFRVRKILDDICPKKLVIAKSGSYAINDQLTLILDTEVFDRICERVKNTNLTDSEKQLIYERGLRVYKGDMLPSTNPKSGCWAG
jgi:two-component SAPR family response regulator